MLFKLSMSGLKSKRKDYIVLLVGLIMSISIFYMFQTLALNKTFIEGNSMDGIFSVFQTGSFLLGFITLFYILHANSFLLSLRQKEFGMYMVLGAKKHKITLLMCIETIVLGMVSLIVGVVFGIILAQGVGYLLMKELEFTGVGYHAFYVPSIIVTFIFFIALFMLSAIMNGIKLVRNSLLQLVHSNDKTAGTPTKGNLTNIVALLSIVLLAVGYISMIYMKELKESGFIIATITVTLGTYMLFTSFLPIIINKLKANKNCSETGINAFTLAQLSFSINSLTKVLATVAMLVALGAGAISSGMALKNNVTNMIETFDYYDVGINNPTVEEKKILSRITFKEKNEYRYKVDDQFIYYLKEDLEANRLLIPTGGDDGKQFISVSKELPVGAVLSRGPEKIENDILIPEEWRYALRTLQKTYVYPNQSIKIVDKKMYDEIQGEERIVFFGKTEDFMKYEQRWKQIDELEVIKYKEVEKTELRSKYMTYKSLYSTYSGTVFMGFFLGIAFLAMLASSLMFKILSSTSKDIIRYQMLRKIGVRYELLTKSIYKELLFVFLFPAIVGIMHVLVGMNMFSFIINNPYFRIWLPIIIFLVIYVAYYFITVQFYKKIVLPKEV
ncbi:MULTISPECIES: FtsX-like permease family protein [Bacillus]|uniref:ABC transporter permease n=1 Tax=Bacillus wiedmannii TaxID=1890302 RepID=A0A2B5XXT2_9BACI|nr:MULTISPECIES: ABC transporter permease [Bacillus]OUB83640.1 ABC transporter permease [Bacillus thuringiensis serovar sinensis]MCU5113366.1 ABC transporter permease [Bacillus wiedmannii]MCU5153248.1 ABC transporter permease [Bacillus wiedmannii]MCU5412958.1 ABC transporter permease [Bacillus wiedmannii]MRS24628.1 FtsX-like permease family protein [Bacillus sp. RIT694]